MKEENLKLKQVVAGSGQRLSSVLNDEEAGSGSRRLSLTSNGSIAESVAVPVPVTEKVKLVTFGSSIHDDNENHTKINADGIGE